MTGSIQEGTILIQAGTRLPAGLPLKPEPDSDGWATVEKLDRSEIAGIIHETGWNFFYMAGRIQASAVGFNRQETLRVALQRIIATVESQRCNCLEITQVIAQSFLKVPYVTVSAHSRHIQRGRVFAPASVLGERSAPPGMFRPGLHHDDERAPAYGTSQ